MDAHEDVYQATLDHMNETLEELEPNVSLNHSIASAANPTGSSAFPLQHLPSINLPTFSGKFED